MSIARDRSVQEAYLGGIPVYEVAFGSVPGRINIPAAEYSQPVQNYITATGITSTEAEWVQTLYDGLISCSLWNKLDVIYPFLGTTAASQAVNLKNTGSFDLTYYGSWEFSASGSKSNGIDAYAGTGFRPDPNNLNWDTDASFGVYNQVAYTDGYDLGTQTTGTAGNQTGLQILNESNLFMPGLPVSASYDYPSNGLGFFQSSRVDDINYGQIDDTLVLSGSVAAGAFFVTDREINLAAIYQPSTSTVVEFANRLYGYAFIGKGLTTDEMECHNSLVQQFAASAGRNLPVPTTTTTSTTSTTTTTTTTTTTSTTSTTTTTTAPTPAAQFISTAGITNPTQQTAITDLYNDLVAAGLWNEVIALWPFVGGTSTTHQYNLVNTAQYQLNFNGGWTHNSNGITGNATNTYADTGLAPSTIANWGDDILMGVYSRTNSVGNYYDFGAYSLGNRQTALLCRYTGDGASFLNGTQAFSTTSTNSTGFFAGCTYTALKDNQGIYRNGSLIVNDLDNTGTSITNRPLFIGSINANGASVEPSNRNYALAIVTRALTVAQNSTLYSIIQDYQTTLGRNV